MTQIEGSVVGRLWLTLWGALLGWYDHSVVHRFLAWLSALWGRWFNGSAIAGLVVREGTLPQAWSGSGFARGLEWIMNLPARVLHWIYRKGKVLFDGSVATRLAFGMGEATPAALSWLVLAMMVIPYKKWDNMYSFGGFALMAALFILGGMRREEQRFRVRPIGPYCVFFAIFVAVSAVGSCAPNLSLRFLFFHITCMLCVLVTVSAIQREGQLIRLTGFAVAGLSVMAGYGVIQGIQGVPVNYSYVDPLVNAGMPGRVYSLYENPNSFAETLVLLIPLAVALLLGSKSFWGKLYGLCALALGGVAIGMTYSRASWIGVVVALVVFVFLWNRKLLPALLVAALACVPLLPDAIYNRILTIFNTKDTSTASRFPVYEAALRVIRQRPLQGLGLGSDAVRRGVKAMGVYHSSVPFVHGHNLYLQIWMETGVFGLLSYLAAMLSGMKAAAKAVKSPSCGTFTKLIVMAAVGAVCGIMVNCMADYMWHYPRVMVIFWFVFALLLAGTKLAEQGEETV